MIFRKTAERAKELFAQGDHFIAQGYVREFTDQHGNEREEFIAKKIGHDPMWTPYTVNRARSQKRCSSRLPASTEARSSSTSGPRSSANRPSSASEHRRPYS